MRILPNEAVLNTLRCPLCQQSMTLRVSSGGASASLVCAGARRHCYDVASSGYINLATPGHSDGGDSKDAVRARRDFLNLGYYAPAAEGLVDAVSRYARNGVLIDAGCGEGYYSELLAKKGFSVACVDLSRPAVDAAAKRFSRAGLSHGFFGVASVYTLPFADESADVLVNVFAPCAEQEFCRVLKPNGILAVMYAGKDHLMGLKQAIYDTVHENDGRADLPKDLRQIDEQRVHFEISVEGSDALQNLFAMTPYYWKTSREDGEKLKKLAILTTTVDMMIAIYKKDS